MPDLTCTTCGFHLPDPPGRKYIVVFPQPWGGLRVEVGCEHRAVDPDGAAAVFSSHGCFEYWLANAWAPSLLAACQHPGGHGPC